MPFENSGRDDLEVLVSQAPELCHSEYRSQTVENQTSPDDQSASSTLPVAFAQSTQTCPVLQAAQSSPSVISKATEESQVVKSESLHSSWQAYKSAKVHNPEEQNTALSSNKPVVEPEKWNSLKMLIQEALPVPNEAIPPPSTEPKEVPPISDQEETSILSKESDAVSVSIKLEDGPVSKQTKTSTALNSMEKRKTKHKTTAEESLLESEGSLNSSHPVEKVMTTELKVETSSKSTAAVGDTVRSSRPRRSTCKIANYKEPPISPIPTSDSRETELTVKEETDTLVTPSNKGESNYGETKISCPPIQKGQSSAEAQVTEEVKVNTPSMIRRSSRSSTNLTKGTKRKESGSRGKSPSTLKQEKDSSMEVKATPSRKKRKTPSIRNKSETCHPSKGMDTISNVTLKRKAPDKEHNSVITPKKSRMTLTDVTSPHKLKSKMAIVEGFDVSNSPKNSGKCLSDYVWTKCKEEPQLEQISEGTLTESVPDGIDSPVRRSKTPELEGFELKPSDIMCTPDTPPSK